jgi:hypothetical protein
LRLRAAAVEDQHRRAIGLAILGEDVPPLHLGAAEHLGDEAAHVVLRRAGAPRGRRRLLHLWLALAVQHLRAADQQARIDAERPADQAEDHDGTDAQAAATDRKAETAPAAAVAAFAASILDVAAFLQVVQAHGILLVRGPGLKGIAAVRPNLPPRGSTRRCQYSC